jgi:hypothetical protein
MPAERSRAAGSGQRIDLVDRLAAAILEACPDADCSETWLELVAEPALGAEVAGTLTGLVADALEIERAG